LHLPLRSHFVDRIHGSHLLMHADGDFFWRVCRHAGADTLSSSPSRHLRDGATPAIRRENKKRQISELIPPAKRMLRSRKNTDITNFLITKALLKHTVTKQHNITRTSSRNLEKKKNPPIFVTSKADQICMKKS